MPPDMLLYPCTGIGTGTATSLLCEVISSIRKALPLATPVPGRPVLWRKNRAGVGGQEE